MMKEVIKEKVEITADGTKYYSRVRELVSDDEYYTRKYYENSPHSSFEKIFEAYEDYIDSKCWD